MPFDPSKPFEEVTTPVATTAKTPSRSGFDPNKPFVEFDGLPKYNDGVSILKDVYPNAVPTSGYRSPDDPLSKRNPRSMHQTGMAIDVERIPGMTFNQYVQGYKDRGFEVIQAQDEYANPSPWATGGHWHVTLAGGPTVPEAAPGVSPPKPVAPRTFDQDQKITLPTAEVPIGTPLDKNTVPVPDQQLEQREGVLNYLWDNRQTKVPADELIAHLKKTYPGLVEKNGERAFRYYIDHFRAGGPKFIDFVGETIPDAPIAKSPFDIDTTTAEKFGVHLPTDLNFKPPLDNSTSISATPPLTPFQVLKKRAEEMASMEGEGLNAALARQLYKSIRTPEEEVRDAAAVVQERLWREQVWNDQARRTSNPVGDFVGGMLGDLAGDFNPTYLYGPGKTIPARIFAQGGAGGATDLVTQGLEVSQGIREGIDPERLALNTVASGAFQGLVEGAGQLATIFHEKGAKVATFDNPRVIEVDTPPATTASPPTPAAPAKRGRPKKVSVADTVKATLGDEVAKITKGWETQPPTVIHASRQSMIKTAPDLYNTLRKDGALHAPGFLDAKGNIHILAWNLGDKPVGPLIYHEALGHLGLAKKFGDALDETLIKIADTNWRVRKEAKEYEAAYPRPYTRNLNPYARAVEEVLAMRSEGGVINKTARDRLSQVVREYGRKMGLDLRYSDREVNAILADVHKTITGGGQEATPSGNRYMYTGTYGNSDLERSGLLPDKYYEALDRAEKGEDASPGSQVHVDTGWFLGPDGKFRREISDHVPSRIGVNFPPVDPLAPPGGNVHRLGDILDHPELYSMYPELQNLPVDRQRAFLDTREASQGWYDDTAGARMINITPYSQDPVSTLFHEIQHYIQDVEGWAKGGNTKTAVAAMTLPHAKIVGEKVLTYSRKVLTKAKREHFIIEVASKDPDFQALSNYYRSINWSEGAPDNFYEVEKKLQDHLYRKVFGDVKYFDIPRKARGEFGLLLAKIAHTSLDDLVSYSGKEVSKLKVRVSSLEALLDRPGNGDGLKTMLTKVLNDVEDLPFQAYEHLFGEVEARDVENRLKLTPGERMAIAPYTSEDHIEPSDYILKYMMEHPEDRGKNRAGSINLDKIVISDGIDTHSLYRDFAEGIDKKKVSFDDAILAVESQGITPSQLMRKQMKVDPTIGISASVALQKGHHELRLVQEKILAGEGTTKDHQKFAYLLARQAAMQAKVAGFRSDFGRGLAFMKIAVDRHGPIPKELLDRMGGADLTDRELLYSIAQALHNQDNNIAAKAKIIKDAFEPLPEDYFLSFRYSMMLYGLGTHVKNFLGNASLMLTDLAEHGVAATIGQARRLNGSERVRGREVSARTLGILKAVFAGQTWRDAGTAFKTGHPPHQISKVEGGHNLFSEKFGAAGAAIDAPQKALAMSDSFFRSLIDRSYREGLAVRQALDEGLSGAKLADRVQELVMNPSEAVQKSIDFDAAVLQLISEPSPIGKLVEIGKAKPRKEEIAKRAMRFGLHMFLPFTRVADNLLWAGMRRVPFLGFLDGVNRADWKAGGPRRDLVIARMLLGGAVIKFLWDYADEDNLSGEGPSQYQPAAQLQASGWQPNSIKAEGAWHSLQGLDALSFLANSVATIKEKQRAGELSDEDAISEGINLIGTVSNLVAKGTFLEEVGTLFSTIGFDSRAENARENYAANMAGSFIPAAVRQSTEIADGKVRDATGDGTMTGKIVGRIKASIPGERETLPVRHDVYGREIASTRNLSGVNQTREVDTNPVIIEIQRLTEVNGGKALVSPVTRGDLSHIVKNAPSDLVQDYQALAGSKAFSALTEFILSEEYQSMSDDDRISEIKRTVSREKKAAREELIQIDGDENASDSP